MPSPVIGAPLTMPTYPTTIHYAEELSSEPESIYAVSTLGTDTPKPITPLSLNVILYQRSRRM